LQIAIHAIQIVKIIIINCQNKNILLVKLI